MFHGFQTVYLITKHIFGRSTIYEYVHSRLKSSKKIQQTSWRQLLFKNSGLEGGNNWQRLLWKTALFADLGGAQRDCKLERLRTGDQLWSEKCIKRWIKWMNKKSQKVWWKKVELCFNVNKSLKLLKTRKTTPLKVKSVQKELYSGCVLNGLEKGQCAIADLLGIYLYLRYLKRETYSS